MAANDPIRRSFHIVDKGLRAVFPDSYWKRCTYAAFGMRMLLQEVGITSHIVFGDMLCFTMTHDGKKPLLGGYGNAPGDAPSHYWLEAAGSILDLGPHYLPCSASRPIVGVPLIRWPVNTPMPSYLRYREAGRGDHTLRSSPSIADRVAQFLEHCQVLRQSSQFVTAVPTWQLKGEESLRLAARKGDPWARGALIFASRINPLELPF